MRAGVLPKLAEKTDDKRWEWLRFTLGETGDDPFMAFQLKKRGNIDDIAAHYLAAKPGSGQLLLFIDQFEELFTLVAEGHRQPFINLLEKAVQSPLLRIILTVRVDFQEHCLNYPALTQLINSGNWNLSTPGFPALWLMIEEPAKAAGLQFEDGLIKHILNDTGTGPGALALMAFALEQLYLACAPATTLTCKVYEDLGGVPRAIGRHAEETYNKLDAETQHALGEVFAELVTVYPERGAPARKPVNLTRMVLSDAARQLIDAFIGARLLVKREIENIDSTTRASEQETVVEVAHEGLLTHWELLNNWINERFGDFCLLRQVRTEAAEWERNGSPEANLWPHERLQKVYDMQQKLIPQLSESVCAFIRPEAERLVEKLNNPELNHQQREHIGVRIAEIGDPRPCVGVDENGLPQFEWFHVPPGRITLEENGGTFDVAAFCISKYPVTFRQYYAFLEAADGYQDPRWWADLKHEPEPGEQFRKIDNHPAERVSWFDAMAFCRWLSAKLRVKIRLPAEWEWQQAATGGNPENGYPWGKDFYTLRCNTYESGLGRTTAVGLYPEGMSPVKALDMSGNVWEWCSNSYDKPECNEVPGDDRRVVRGGSWNDSQGVARAASRFRGAPGLRGSGLGFRVVCSSPII